jgi:hypothetical protein
MKHHALRLGIVAAFVVALAGAGIGIVAAQTNGQTPAPTGTDAATPAAPDDASSPDAAEEANPSEETDPSEDADHTDKSAEDAADNAGKKRDGHTCDKNGNGIPDNEESGSETDETSSLTF